MRTLLLAATLTALAVPVTGQADDADPVAAKLNKALVTYNVEMAAYREKGTAWLDAREQAIRKTGSKKAVDAHLDARSMFDRTDELPKSAPPELVARQVEARARVVKAYELAVREYVRGKQDAKAATLERELEAIKLGVDPTDPRRRWVHSKGEFRVVKRGEWEERDMGQGRLRWKEVNRTAEYVELEIILDGKKNLARLYDKRDSRKVEGDEFKPLFRGEWVN